jgi:hypothetical protein
MSRGGLGQFFTVQNPARVRFVGHHAITRRSRGSSNQDSFLKKRRPLWPSRFGSDASYHNHDSLKGISRDETSTSYHGPASWVRTDMRKYGFCRRYLCVV